VKLDRDERDAFAAAAAVVLRYFVVALGLLLFARVMLGCGGAEFTGLGPIPADAGLVDAITASVGMPDAPVSTGPQSPDVGKEGASSDPADDAGASMRDAGTVLEPPRIDAGDPPPVLDAGGPPPPPPPPPALCCVTPCQGSSPAAITCGNGGDWTCAAGACTAGACSVGAACEWMGTCAGRVEVCP
jgi:hypothetical protein